MQSIPTISPAFYFASLPILILCMGSIVLMLQTVLGSHNARSTKTVAFVLLSSLLAAFLACVSINSEEVSFLAGAYLFDPFTRSIQAILLAIPFFLCLLTLRSPLAKKFFRSEIACLMLISVLGMLVMVSSLDLVSIFIGLELSSIGIYAMVGYVQPNRASQEGAIKYFLLGSFATAILLFGIGLLYASSGSLNLLQMIAKLNDSQLHFWTKIGAIATISGLAFKLALAPFHLWSPDAYEAAPTNITALMATSVKIMIITIIVRLFSLDPVILEHQWAPAMLAMAGVSIIFGNILALVQTSIKRTLAYSAISHSGYLGIALAITNSANILAPQAIMFYLLGYSLSSLLAFGILICLEDDKNQNLELNDLAGLAKRHPYAALGLTIALISFAGLPPTVGFLGKFFIFNVAIQQKFFSIVIIAAVGSAIALFYYLRIVVYMYMKNDAPNKLNSEKSYLNTSILGCAGIAILLLGTVLPNASIKFLKSRLDIRPRAESIKLIEKKLEGRKFSQNVAPQVQKKYF